MKLLPRALVCLAIAVTSAWGRESSVAVSIRYLQIEGVSHGHIYLYSASGKLIRQLTNQKTGQDILPVFSPDGLNVVFIRTPRLNVHQSPDSKDELWSIDVNGENAHRLNSPPAWYGQLSQNADCFTVPTLAEEDWERSGKFDETLRPTPTPKPSRLLAPDRSFELILDRTGDDRKDYDQQQLGKLYRLRNLQSGEQSLVGDWAGFETLWDPLHLRGQENCYFLIQPPLRTVFFFTHLNSTAGDTVHALDLTKKKVIRLAANWAVPIPVPGEPVFFVESEERYVPLGDGKRTVNCSYLDKWDAEFHKVRYAWSIPAIFGGASVWRDNGSVLTMHWAVRNQ